MGAKGKGKGKGGKGKGKGGKGKKKNSEEEAKRKAMGIEDTESEEYKQNLMLELYELRQEAETEDRFTSLYQQERERINHFWLAEKKKVEEMQADLKNKEFALQDLKERHDIEIKVCKQRVKHLLFHNLDSLVEERTTNEITLKNAEDDHRYKQRELKYDVRSLKVQEKEKEVCHEEYLRALKKEQDQKMMELRHDFERRANDLKEKYTEKMNRTRNEMESKKKMIIEQIEKQIQKEVGGLRRSEANDLKKLQKLQYENKQCVNPLKETRAKVADKKKELEMYKKDKAELHQTRLKILELEEEIRSWTWEYEVLLQQHNYVAKERDEVFNKFQDSILEVQQKTGLKNLILEKKLETISETLEAKDVQLHQVLSAANMNPDAIAQVSASLEDIENNKNEQISVIQSELKRIREAHSNMVKTYEGKLAEFGIPVEELGFDPLVPANV
jgi:hypothetical protein